MANNFEMVGKVTLSKGTEKQPTFETKTFDSGWTLNTLRLQVDADGNKHYVDVKGGYGGNDDSLIHSMVKKSDGSKGYDKIQFKYRDREQHIHNLAEFKKYVFVDGENRAEFTTQFDLANYVHIMLKNGEYEGKKFKISGDVEFSEYKDTVYTNYIVNRMYVVSNDEQELAEAQLEMYIGETCIVDDNLDETGKMYIKGHVGQYNGVKKADIGIAQVVEVHIAEDDKKKDRKIAKIKETCEPKSDDFLSRVGLKVKLVNKSEEVEFNESMLSDEEREDLELEFTTIEELKVQYGVGKGKFERKMVFKGFGRGFSKGCIETGLTLAELLRKAENKAKNTNLEIDTSTDLEDDEDLFE